jgi:peptide chain release factor 1
VVADSRGSNVRAAPPHRRDRGRARALEERLADPDTGARPGEYAETAKELGRLRPLLDAGARYRKLLADVEGARALLEESDEELRKELRLLLVPRDPNDDRNVILEIRAGTGGEEASLFAADLFRMYARYAERRRWKVEPLVESESRSRRRQGDHREVSGDRVSAA